MWKRILANLGNHISWEWHTMATSSLAQGSREAGKNLNVSFVLYFMIKMIIGDKETWTPFLPGFMLILVSIYLVHIHILAPMARLSKYLKGFFKWKLSEESNICRANTRMKICLGYMLKHIFSFVCCWDVLFYFSACNDPVAWGWVKTKNWL